MDLMEFCHFVGFFGGFFEAVDVWLKRGNLNNLAHPISLNRPKRAEKIGLDDQSVLENGAVL